MCARAAIRIAAGDRHLSGAQALGITSDEVTDLFSSIVMAGGLLWAPLVVRLLDDGERLARAVHLVNALGFLYAAAATVEARGAQYAGVALYSAYRAMLLCECTRLPM